MCHVLLQTPSFFGLLLRIDGELAEETKAAGCRICVGVLHRANYPRKPKGCLKEFQDEFSSRFSFCCNLCHKRCTPVSVRFLGQRGYLGIVVVLMSTRRVATMSAAGRLCATLEIPLSTITRWRHWWRHEFPLTPLWQAACARFMPPVATEELPWSLIERFAAPSPSGAEQLLRLLCFLTPMTVRAPVELEKGR